VRLATWNVNSLRVRLPQVLDWLGAQQPDVLALQETKLADPQFPAAEVEALGYQAVYAGQPTYNGVAVLARHPMDEVLTDAPGLDDPQQRILAVTVQGVRLIDLYVPNGQAVGSEKFDYKLDWLAKVTAWLRAELAAHPWMAVMGDFNIAPEDRDVHDPEAWRETVLCSTPEREAFQRLMAVGLCDVFRRFEQPEGEYTWWDYRMNNFRRNRGLRIDHILASPSLCAAAVACRVDKAPRGAERPSDHAPVLADFTGPWG
jgi:exodeoxyribonuclease-3